MLSGLFVLVAFVMGEVAADARSHAPSPANTTECSYYRPIELVFLFDGTSSFSSLLEDAKVWGQEVYSSLSEEIDDLQVSVATFGDHFGPDRCIRNYLSLSRDDEAIRSAFSYLRGLWGGGTPPEDPLEAMAYMAHAGAGFSLPADKPNILRLMMVLTDAEAHIGDASPDLTVPTYPCGTSDPYASASVIEAPLKEKEIYPVIAVTASSIESWWRSLLVDTLHYNESFISVLPIIGSSDTVADELVQVVLDFACNLEQVVTTVKPLETTPRATSVTETEAAICTPLPPAIDCDNYTLFNPYIHYYVGDAIIYHYQGEGFVRVYRAQGDTATLPWDPIGICEAPFPCEGLQPFEPAPDYHAEDRIIYQAEGEDFVRIFRTDQDIPANYWGWFAVCEINM